MDQDLYEDWITPLGEEYPAAILVGDVRIPLAYETRFKRHYTERLPDGGEGQIDISRFLDGTASITLDQLKQDWSSWSEPDRADFCASIHELEMIEQQDFVEIIRWLLENASCAVLGPVVLALPREEIFAPQETFDFLIRVLQRAPPEHGSDVVRALALTRHPEAESAIRRRLAGLLANPGLWLDAPFFNRIAQSVAYCLLSLIELNVPAEEFEILARRLSAHPCANSGGWFQRNFAKHYNWLPPTNWPNWPR